MYQQRLALSMFSIQRQDIQVNGSNFERIKKTGTFEQPANWRELWIWLIQYPMLKNFYLVPIKTHVHGLFLVCDSEYGRILQFNSHYQLWLRYIYIILVPDVTLQSILMTRHGPWIADAMCHCNVVTYWCVLFLRDENVFPEWGQAVHHWKIECPDKSLWWTTLGCMPDRLPKSQKL